MNKKIVLCALLLVCTLLFSACQSNKNPYTPMTEGQNVFGDVTGNNNVQQTQQSQQSQQTQQNDDMLDFDGGEYDPTLEEDSQEDQISTLPQNPPAPVSEPAEISEYAGATPVVIDPIDKPTATPMPPLSFTYQVYDAPNVHLVFEGPVGWTVDASQPDTYIITNPASGMDYQAQVVLKAVSVDSAYDKRALEQVIENMLDEIGDGSVTKFSPSRTAERDLMDADGIYANYTATTKSGAKIAGRVHATCINKVLYTIHISYPQGYTETYKDTVYAQLRKTLSITR